MARLSLIVGHEKTAQGAWGEWPIGMHEYLFNRVFAQEIAYFLHSVGHDTSVILRDGIGIAGAYKIAMEKSPSAIIELHFNAADKKATGTETLILTDGDMPGIHEKLFAEEIQKTMVEVLGLRDRGVKDKSRGDRGAFNLDQTKMVPSILIEPAFGDNPSDAIVLMSKRVELAYRIAMCFSRWVGRQLN